MSGQGSKMSQADASRIQSTQVSLSKTHTLFRTY
jgi:hypothetical protein